MKPFGPFKYQNGYVTGPDRFSETVGMKPSHTLIVAQMFTPYQTVGLIDDADMDACGNLLAAAPDLLAALEFITAPQPYSATQEWRDNVKKGRELALAAIAKAKGKADA